MTTHTTVRDVTDRIRQRSQGPRSDYLTRLAEVGGRERGSDRMGCANVAHAVAGIPANDKLKVVAERAPNIGVVTAYNDMLSAHAPFQGYPDIIKHEARRLGATAQVAGGVPAMCDGVTQGLPGMELSLFSRDIIAMSTAIALTHDMFDAALMLGVCDKIVPGLLIGALHFGHLPTVFVPAGPMPSGLSNNEKSKVREQAAQGLVGRAGPAGRRDGGLPRHGHLHLLRHGQQQPDAARGHGPACARHGFHPPRRFDARGAHARGRAHGARPGHRIGFCRAAHRQVVDERCIVNAMVALLATGGSTNHLIHWVAVARAAGIVIDWDDFRCLSDVVPLLSRVYPNGSADVNQFQAAGGPGYRHRRTG